MTELIATSNTTLQASFGADLFSRFIDYTAVKDTTLKGYMVYIRAFVRWMHGNGIAQPTREDVKAYKEYLDSSELATSTKAQYLRAVRHFFKWTAAEGLYPDVADHIKGAKVRHDHHKKDALGREDVPAIAATIDRSTEQGKRLFAIYMLCITAGLRTVEVSRANIEDVKTKGGKSYLWVWGKGHDEPDSPVLLVPEVKDALQAYLDSRSDKPTAKSPLFVSTSNRSKAKRIAPTTISAQIKKMMRAAGYDSSRLTAHSLRHTSGTGAYQATHNLYLTQQHQRHVDPSTTEIYIHDNDREQRDTEQQVYNYYFAPDAKNDPTAEALQILRSLDPAKQQAALSMLRAMR